MPENFVCKFFFKTTFLQFHKLLNIFKETMIDQRGATYSFTVKVTFLSKKCRGSQEDNGRVLGGRLIISCVLT